MYKSQPKEAALSIYAGYFELSLLYTISYFKHMWHAAWTLHHFSWTGMIGVDTKCVFRANWLCLYKVNRKGLTKSIWQCSSLLSKNISVDVCEATCTLGFMSWSHLNTHSEKHRNGRRMVFLEKLRLMSGQKLGRGPHRLRWLESGGKGQLGHSLITLGRTSGAAFLTIPASKSHLSIPCILSSSLDPAWTQQSPTPALSLILLCICVWIVLDGQWIWYKSISCQAAKDWGWTISWTAILIQTGI